MFQKIEDTITNLQKQTVEQLKATVTADMTKRDLLIAAYGSDKTIETDSTYRKDKQIESQTSTLKDIETNEVILTRTITWTYYPKGEVDEITITENGKAKIIKHYVDGRQPTVKE